MSQGRAQEGEEEKGAQTWRGPGLGSLGRRFPTSGHMISVVLEQGVLVGQVLGWGRG